MMLCVYHGIPPTDNGTRPSWRGFLYASTGLALIYGALDQGQRLDWWNSGVFVGMLAGGTFLLLTAVVRRYCQPNPMINLAVLERPQRAHIGSGNCHHTVCAARALGRNSRFPRQYRAVPAGSDWRRFGLGRDFLSSCSFGSLRFRPLLSSLVW